MASTTCESGVQFREGLRDFSLLRSINTRSEHLHSRLSDAYRGLSAALAVSEGLRKIYGPLILHMLPTSVHRSGIRAFKGTINLKLVRPVQYMGFNPPLSLKA
jgi:hypothetical protein